MNSPNDPRNEPPDEHAEVRRSPDAEKHRRRREAEALDRLVDWAVHSSTQTLAVGGSPTSLSESRASSMERSWFRRLPRKFPLASVARYVPIAVSVLAAFAIPTLYARHQSLRSALDWYAPLKAEKDELIYENPTEDPGSNAEPGYVELEVRNVKLPVALVWKVAKQPETYVYLGAGDSLLQLPAGPDLTIFLRSTRSQAFQQSAVIGRWSRGEYMPLGHLVGKGLLRPEPGDQFTLVCNLPTPPWNSAIVPFRGSYLLVILERPDAMYHADEWQQIRSVNPRAELLPNTMQFWALYGTDEFATRIARQVYPAMQSDNWTEAHRTNMHVTIDLPARDTRVVDALRSATEEEFRSAILMGLKLLEQNSTPRGGTITDQVEIARAYLATHSLPELVPRDDLEISPDVRTR